ncbi:hypothetical protein [Qipengyuania sp.]|uniref:hypothetical protein n=1 Tax=Qipengyuania sp. TaxID=2004515 RepID=UPI003518566A
MAASDFEIDRNDALAPERGGRLGSVSLGEPLWHAKYELSRSMSLDLSDEWRAFAARLRGPQRVLVGQDRTRRYPRNYPDGFAKATRVAGTPFDGAAASWSQAINSDLEATLTLNDLPAGLRLERGDYVGFRWDAAGSPAGTHDRLAMVRLVSPAMANAAGTLDALVEMPVPTLVVPAGAEAHLDNPACLMKVVQGGVKLGDIDTLGTLTGGTIEAMQDLRP